MLSIPYDRKVFGLHRDIPRAPVDVSRSSVVRLTAQRVSAEAPPPPVQQTTT